MDKRLRKYCLCLMALAMSCGLMAQNQAPAEEIPCWQQMLVMPGLPSFYCDCVDGSVPFAFPYAGEIQPGDTLWFSANVNQLKQGLSAYWFSSGSVTIEVYATCASKAPTITLTVGANQMREMDVAKINRKIDEMGTAAGSLMDALTPRVRVYANGQPGQVYCYPYDQGPRSTCDNTLPMLPRMTYVCDSTYEVYEIQPARISADGQGFIHWKQKRNEPCTITLHADSCNGEVIGRKQLSDSMRVYQLDATLMQQLKTAQRSVFVEVQHDAGITGRVWYYNTIRALVEQTDTTICQGMYIELPDTSFYETTTYNDTLWLGSDTLSYSLFHLTVTPPDTIADTLQVKASKLPMIYRNQERINKDGWGDYHFLIHQNEGCDEFVNLHVARTWTNEYLTVDTTLCEGKSISVGGQTYTTDTQIQDSLWTKNGDVWTVRDITIHFTTPETEYDTLTLKPSEIAGEGYLYSPANELITAYGTYTFTIKAKNKCTRIVQLTVLQGEDDPTPPVDPDTPEDPDDPENPESLDTTQTTLQTYIFRGRDGMLYIRRGEQIYTIIGNNVQ